jgi:hypothetical protein
MTEDYCCNIPIAQVNEMGRMMSVIACSQQLAAKALYPTSVKCHS